MAVDVLKQKARENKKWVGYIFFTFVLAACLLYYCFPSDAFRNYLQTTAERIGPQYFLSLEKVNPTFPPGLTLRKTRLSLKTYPDTSLFTADSLVVRPEIWSFLKGGSGYRFNCLAYGGRINGYVHFSGNSIKAPFSTSLRLKDIHIDNYAAASFITGSDIKGIIGGTIEYKGQYDSDINGSGEAKLTISDVRVELLQPIFSFDSIDLESIRIKMSLKNQKISVTHVELKGQKVRGSLSGTITLKKDILKSGLNLRGAIEFVVVPHKGTKGAVNTIRILRTRSKSDKLNFIVGGTFTSPSFRLI